MATLPLEPHLKHYRGAKENLQRKYAEENRIRMKVAEHVNRLIANDPEPQQQYLFGFIAADLGVTKDQVRDAISDGGYNGITLWITRGSREIGPIQRGEINCFICGHLRSEPRKRKYVQAPFRRSRESGNLKSSKHPRRT